MTPERLADALHRVAGGSEPLELHCYCRRIATTDGTLDGPDDPTWGEAPYDPADWGDGADRPTLCERIAAGIIEAMDQ